MYRLKRTFLDLVLDAAALAGVVVGVALTALHLPSLPAAIPLRFSFSGTPVGSGPKQTLWILSGTSAFTFVLLAALSRAPHLHNYLVKITEENVERQYRNSMRALQTVNVLAAWMFAVIIWELIAAAKTGAPVGNSAFFFIGAVLAAVVFFVLRSWRLR